MVKGIMKDKAADRLVAYLVGCILAVVAWGSTYGWLGLLWSIIISVVVLVVAGELIAHQLRENAKGDGANREW